MADPYALIQQQAQVPRQRLMEDLHTQEQNYIRQLGEQEQQFKWGQEDINRQIGSIGQELPEQLGRLASSYAARGSYHSGARSEAESDMSQQAATQQQELQRQAERANTEWSNMVNQNLAARQQLHVAAGRGLQDLEAQIAAAQAEYKQGLASGGSGRGGGSGGSKGYDPNEAAGYASVRTQFYQAQGNDLRTAQAKASVETRQKYPGISNQALFGTPAKAAATSGVQNYAAPILAYTKPISAAQIKTIKSGPSGDVYSNALQAAKNYHAQRLGPATNQDFLNWWIPRLSKTEKNSINSYIRTLSQVLRDAPWN